ncbi:CHAP domain-containing protein [Diaminobutyricibacter tongyongensis]|uniref:CHAP domain-containing protein n=1 Tax=Leifsonia tongyongensis TaxID=1268043 RepID=A0A6L9XWG4_9MICO|nr:amidase domain-containing protein [Diaminobutyricibacter tongyongensis]NEN05626.1 CHAP domain-containing protein [Diaminobutyricibacter tongyongensis]
MRSGLPRSTRSRFLALAGAVAATALLLTGCAGSNAPAAGGNPPAPAAASAPTAITSVSPATGSVSGTNTVTLAGTSLANVKSVTIGGQAATISSTGSDKLAVVVPQAASFQPNKVDIVVLGAGGKPLATLAGGYQYQVITPVDKQLNYAMQHWNNYNTAQYGDLNPVGGDCANFVSQTLIARGWTQNDDWYNRDAAASWSPSWGYVPAMDNYFSSTPSLGLHEYPFDDRDKIKVGDIVMFDWNDNDSLDHVQIVSQVIHQNGKILIKMVGHNTDSDYRDLDTAITVDHPGAVGHFWSFTA